MEIPNQLKPLDSLRKNIDAELVYLLYSQASAGIVGSLFLATCVVLVLLGVISTKVLLTWYGVMLAVGVVRLGIIKFYLARNHSLKKNYFWKKVFIFIITLAGLTWGAAVFLIPPNAVYQTFLTCVLAGVSASGIPYFAGSRAACAVYILPILLPFAFWSFLHIDMPHRVLGIFTIIYMMLLLFSSFKTHRAIRDAIKLKFENDELVRNLSIAKKEAEKINQELQVEINERKLAEKLLRDSEEQYRLVTDALPVLISYIDTDLKYRFNNKAHEIWFGKSLKEITKKPVKDILDTTAYAIFAENYEKISDKKQITYETVMNFRDGEERYVSVTLLPHIQEGKMEGVFSLISDMTPRINYLATHDALTDLPNRSLFNARMSQALKRAHPLKHRVALLFMDLDHFKNINDTLGHEIGDHLLIKVVERTKECLREIDTLARLGGDEFIIILEDIAIEYVISVAEKICQAFNNPFHLEGRDVFITTSIGISIYPEDGEDIQILLKNADMAIYRAKDHGRNTFEFYTKELNEKITKKLTIETNLRAALEKQEFKLYYQPIVDINKKKICGVEALIRWQHPQVGMISPVDFIPIAEEAGLIVPIGEWILQSACKDNIDWKKAGIANEIKTSINLSARQFREKNLAEEITQILQSNSINGESLTLELTESLIMQDVEHSLKIIKKLKDLGISISIDDFGTGYSSLNYLRKFPIDILKIDRSFITELPIRAEDVSIVSTIIAMAHSLKMKVVAEGVETLEQCQFLKNQGCDEIQGFLFSKPVPLDEITPLLHDASVVHKRLQLIEG